MHFLTDIGPKEILIGLVIIFALYILLKGMNTGPGGTQKPMGPNLGNTGGGGFNNQNNNNNYSNQPNQTNQQNTQMNQQTPQQPASAPPVQNQNNGQQNQNNGYYH